MAGLVAATARADDLDRAEAVAQTIDNSYRRVQALAKVAQAAARAGNLDRARKLAGQAEEAAQAITDPDHRPWVLAGLAQAAARAGAWIGPGSWPDRERRPAPSSHHP